jgi:hypothetical protein
MMKVTHAHLVTYRPTPLRVSETMRLALLPEGVSLDRHRPGGDRGELGTRSRQDIKGNDASALADLQREGMTL